MKRIDGPRACTKNELSEVIALVDGALREGVDQSVFSDYPLVYLDKNLDNIRILKVDGELAAVVPVLPRHVVMDGCQFTIGTISPTATAPHHRMQGYGLQCVKSCLEVMNRMGCDLSVLWTMARTFPFYEKAGYQAVRSMGWLYRCFGRDARLFQNRREIIVQLNPDTNDYIDSIRMMHEKEVYGVLRAPEEYPFLFRLPKMKTLVALQRNVPVAYLTVSNAVNKPGLIEAGGDELAVETLLNRALLEKGEGHLDAYGYLTETVLGNLLHRKLPQRRQSFGAAGVPGAMMIRINNVQTFMQKLAKCLQKKTGFSPELSMDITDAEQSVRLHFSRGRVQEGDYKLSHHLEVSRRELVSMIFGATSDHPSCVSAMFQNMLPWYFPIWILDMS